MLNPHCWLGFWAHPSLDAHMITPAIPGWWRLVRGTYVLQIWIEFTWIFHKRKIIYVIGCHRCALSLVPGNPPHWSLLLDVDSGWMTCLLTDFTKLSFQPPKRKVEFLKSRDVQSNSTVLLEVPRSQGPNNRTVNKTPAQRAALPKKRHSSSIWIVAK